VPREELLGAALCRRAVSYCARSVSCDRQLVFCVRMSELSAEEEDLRGVVHPNNDDDDRPSGPVGGTDTRFT
jgi:hypothetical protein